MTAIDYSQSIPNNVNLADDRRLIRGLERWLPAYMDWWHELGPENAKDLGVYLRTDVGRVVQRAAELSKQADSLDIRSLGGIDLPTIQKYINFHYSACLDLFGQELSTNAANYYTMGLKGRYQENKIDDGHLLDNDCYKVPEAAGKKIK